MAKQLDLAIEKIKKIQLDTRTGTLNKRPLWPMIIFRTPKGWRGHKEWDGVPIEGSFIAHQVPVPVDAKHMEHIDALVSWLQSYRPQELFDNNGKLLAEIAEIAPKGNKRMAKNPITNGGTDPKKLILPDYHNYALDNSIRGKKLAQDMIILGDYISDVFKANTEYKNFRVFGPDETMSNRLGTVFQETKRVWMEDTKEPYDQYQSFDGRVVDSQLSEHQAEGFLEGYVLTGRHGIFVSYEAFLRVVDSMVTQHFKWLRKAKE